MIERDTEIYGEFIESVVELDTPRVFSSSPDDILEAANIETLVRHVVSLPGVIRANLYSARREIVWSSDRSLIGKTFPVNDDLEVALKGVPITQISSIDHKKAEYANFGEVGQFIESYIPVHAPGGGERAVIGVVELYRSPMRLSATIAQGRSLIWLSGLAAALFAYGTLFSVMRRSARVIGDQQKKLGALRSVWLVGALSSAVAHSLRNPMAIARSSAELCRTRLSPRNSPMLDVIIQEIDRMNDYISDLLAFAHSDNNVVDIVDPVVVLETVLRRREAALRHHGIVANKNDSWDRENRIRMSPMLLEHAVTSIVNNAIEAMPDGGEINLKIFAGAHASEVVIEISDTGPGIEPEIQAQLAVDRVSTKPRGLGLGLALTREIVEACDGKLSILSERGRGTKVCLAFRKA